MTCTIIFFGYGPGRSGWSVILIVGMKLVEVQNLTLKHSTFLRPCKFCRKLMSHQYRDTYLQANLLLNPLAQEKSHHWNVTIAKTFQNNPYFIKSLETCLNFFIHFQRMLQFCYCLYLETEWHCLILYFDKAFISTKGTTVIFWFLS